MSQRSKLRGGIRVAIVGAGFSGISAAVALKRAGFTSFEVFEKSEGPGGVWWDNRYEGAEVDTPSHIYSFAFQPFEWTRSHAQRDELVRYMEVTIDNWGVRPHIRFNTTVEKAEWDDAAQEWLVYIDGQVHRFDVLISAVGTLNVPRYPTWPGLDDFAGPKFHTARWEHQHDLRGRRVAVVGTGSTAAQIVPRLAQIVGKLSLFQREPGWVKPKAVRTYSDAERRAMRSSWRYRLERWRGFRAAADNRSGGELHKVGSPVNRALTQQCVAYIDSVFKDRPDLKELVTPTYPYMGKRPIQDSNFYPALLRDNVELIPHAVERVTPTGLVDTEGREHEIDVLIMSTGFQASNYLASLPVRGSGGVALADYWAGEPRAFLGMLVPGFPNFFMFYGPNTNGPVLLFNFAQQAKYVVRSLRRLIGHRAAEIEVRPDVFRRFNRWVQEQMQGSVWLTTNNYFRGETGAVVTNWPVSPTTYWWLTRIPLAFTTRLTGPKRPRERQPR